MSRSIALFHFFETISDLLCFNIDISDKGLQVPSLLNLVHCVMYVWQFMPSKQIIGRLKSDRLSL